MWGDNDRQLEAVGDIGNKGRQDGKAGIPSNRGTQEGRPCETRPRESGHTVQDRGEPVLDGASTFPSSCLAWSPSLSPMSPHVCLWRMMRPPFRGLVPPCLPVLDAVSVFPRSCPPLCPFLFPYLGWCVRVSEALSPFLFSFVGWCVCLPEVCPPLSPLVSHCLPACVPHMCAVLCDRLPDSLFFSTCVPVLDGASAFPRSCLRLSPIVFPFACVWMV